MSATLEGPRLLIRARSRPSLLQFLSPVAWQPGSGPFLSLMWSHSLAWRPWLPPLQQQFLGDERIFEMRAHFS